MDIQTISPKVGDILSSTWGYDATYVDFYQVVAVTPASIRIRQVDKKVSEEETTSLRFVPIKDSFLPDDSSACAHEKPFRQEKGGLRKVSIDTVRRNYSCKVSESASAYFWNGSPITQSAH